MKLCKSEASKIDHIKTEQLDMQKQLINRQQNQIDSVQKTVKSEMISWADVVKQNSPKNNQLTVTGNTVKEAVRLVNEEEERSRNLIIYSVKETEEGEWEDVNYILTVSRTFSSQFLMRPAVTFLARRRYAGLGREFLRKRDQSKFSYKALAMWASY